MIAGKNKFVLNRISVLQIMELWINREMPSHNGKIKVTAFRYNTSNMNFEVDFEASNLEGPTTFEGPELPE
jgi:hypothetical protein